MDTPVTGLDKPLKILSLPGALIAIAAAGIVSIGIFALLHSAAGAVAFGLQLFDPRDARLLAIAGTRDIVLGVLLFAFLGLRNRRVLAYAIAVLALIPVSDGLIVLACGDWTFKPVILTHWMSAIFMLAIVALLRRRN